MGLVSQAAKKETTDDGTGSNNAAELSGEDALGGVSTLLGVYWDTSGSAMLTVEAKIDGSWETFDTVSISSADDNVEVYETPYDEMRAFLDQNRNTVVVTAKGVS
jgi:hypothetical protein